MAQAKKSSAGKWRVVSSDSVSRVVVMQRGNEVARFEMGSMRRLGAA